MEECIVSNVVIFKKVLGLHNYIPILPVISGASELSVRNHTHAGDENMYTWHFQVIAVAKFFSSGFELRSRHVAK